MSGHLRFWRWEPQGLGPYDTVRARLMWQTVLVLAGLVLPTVVAQLLIGPVWVAAIPLGFVLNYLTSALLLRAGRQHVAAWMVLAPSCVVLPALMGPFGGVGGTTTIFLQISALLAVLWLEPAGALLIVAFQLGFLALGPYWRPEVDPIFADPQAFGTAMLVTYLLAVTMISIVAGSTLDALRAASAEAARRAAEAGRAAAAAVRATEAKARFLSMMSHELRTPLNAIVGYADLLREDHDPSTEHRDHLERISSSGQRLLAQVDDVLKVAGTMGPATPAPPVMTVRPIDIRERLVRRSVQTLLGGTVLLVALQALGPDPMTHLLRAAPFVVLFGVGLALTRSGRAPAAGWLVLLVGMGWLVAQIVADGPTSREAPYVLLAVTAAWSWLGRRAGVAATAVVWSALIVGWIGATGPPTPVDEWTWVFTHGSAVVLGSTFLACVTRDLRHATLKARDGALAAEAGAAAARDADEARDRFLAKVSSELRAPLDAVLRDADQLRADERDLDRIADLDRICSAGQQLMGLVADVLDMRSLRRGELVVLRETLDLAPLVDGAVRAMAPTAAARDDRISVRIPDRLPEVGGDQQRIHQILTNLLSNAVKHTRGGEIRVDVTEADGELRVAVRDQGKGIAQERLAEVFEAFVQIEQGPDRKPGIGLGLALSQQLAHCLGGRIDAASQPGAGSTFTLALPAARKGSPPTADDPCG